MAFRQCDLQTLNELWFYFDLASATIFVSSFVYLRRLKEFILKSVYQKLFLFGILMIMRALIRYFFTYFPDVIKSDTLNIDKAIIWTN